MEIKDEWKEKLVEMGFQEKEDKPGLWYKSIEDGFTHWDFRKAKKGRYYTSIDGGGIEGGDKVKQDPEYVAFRSMQNAEDKQIPIKKTFERNSNQIAVIKPRDIEIRGNEESITNIVGAMRLEMIVRASKDKTKPGEGILYHDLGAVGLEPSAELVDMISADMGNIETEVVEHGLRTHIDIDTGDEYHTQYAIVRAMDTAKGTTGLGSAEEIMDYKEMKKNNRSFALTKAVRKAERNAKERLIPVPRRAMVELIKEILKQYTETKNAPK